LRPNYCIQTVQMSTPILSKTLPVSHDTSQQRTSAANVKTDSYKLLRTNNSLSANCLFSPPLNTFGTSEGHVQEVSTSHTVAKAINRTGTINELVWGKHPAQPCLCLGEAPCTTMSTSDTCSLRLWTKSSGTTACSIKIKLTLWQYVCTAGSRVQHKFTMSSNKG